MKVLLKGWFKEGPQEVEEMSVNFIGEDFLWFEFKLKNGQTVQSQCFKGSN